MKKLIKITGITLAAAMALTTNVFAWTSHVQDLSKVEVTFDESIDPGVQTNVSKPSSWAEAEVNKAISSGLVPNFTDNPDYTDSITREQFAELAARFASKFAVAEGEKAPKFTAGINFTDCDNTNVLMAAQLGIVYGVGDDKFEPKTTTNREQIAAMISRAIDLAEYMQEVDVTPNAASIEAFADKSEVSDWAAESVGILAANGIMAGTSASELSPKAPCTVEQSIVLLERVYENIIKLKNN